MTGLWTPTWQTLGFVTQSTPIIKCGGILSAGETTRFAAFLVTSDRPYREVFVKDYVVSGTP